MVEPATVSSNIIHGLQIASQEKSAELEQILTKEEESDGEPKSPQVENSGRWSDDEHKRFRMALLKFGRKWSKVARYVRTRTDAQARSHAQKYLRKLRKYGCKGNELEFQILKDRAISRQSNAVSKTDQSADDSSASVKSGSSANGSGDSKKKMQTKVDNLFMLIEAAKQLSYGPFVVHGPQSYNTEAKSP